jgi:hypothetical protein
MSYAQFHYKGGKRETSFYIQQQLAYS